MDHILGIDLGGTNTKLGIVSRDGRLLEQDSIPTSPLEGPESWAQRIGESLSKWKTPFTEVGVGSPGPLETSSGTILFTPNLKSFEGRSLKALLEKQLQKRSFFENDANCAALAEFHFGPLRGTRDLVVITLGTGVGSGIISSGSLVRGHRGFASEIGHTRITANSGPHCHCGRQGCLEAYLGGRRLVERFRELTGQNRSPKEIFQADQDKDPIATQLIDEWAWALSIAIDEMFLLFEPEHLVLSGGLAQAWPSVESRVQYQLNSLPSKEAIKSMKIGMSRLGGYFGVLGAAALVLDLSSEKNG